MPARSFEVGKPQLGLDLDVLYVVIVGPWMSHSMSDFAAWAERCSELRFTYTGCLTAASQLPFLSGLGGEESAGTPIPKCNPDIADQPCDFGRGRGSRYRNSKALWRWRRLQAAKSPEIRGYVWVCMGMYCMCPFVWKWGLYTQMKPTCTLNEKIMIND
jgi:hypothetical protein